MSSRKDNIGLLRIKPPVPGEIELVDILIELDSSFDDYNLEGVAIRVNGEDLDYKPEPNGTFLVEFSKEDERDLVVIKALIEYYGFEVIAEEPYIEPKD